MNKSGGFGQVSGRTTLKGFNTGKSCTVSLFPTETKSDAALYTITSPSPGRFHFAEVMPGKYRVDAAISTDGKTVAKGSAGTVEVKDRQVVENLAITLE
jgi:hypothetical protein